MRYIWALEMLKPRSIFSFAFALLVLFASSNLMVGMHFCSGEIKDVALFAKADVCEKEKSTPPCHRHMASTCCENETIVHEGQDFSASFNEITLPAFQAIAQEFAPSHIGAPPIVVAANFTYCDFDPPLRACDRHALLQVFLI